MLTADEIKTKYRCEDSDVPDILALQQKGYDHGLAGAKFNADDFYDEVEADCVQLDGLLALGEDTMLRLYRRAFREGRVAAKGGAGAPSEPEKKPQAPAEEPAAKAAPKSRASGVRLRRGAKAKATEATSRAQPLESLADMMARGVAGMHERVKAAVGDVTPERIIGLPIIDVGSAT